MKTRIILILITLGLLSGCASGPKYDQVQSSIPALSSDKGRIYFYRTGNMFGAGIQPKVKLNGKEIGASTPGGFFYVDNEPGDYEVVLSTEVDKKLTFSLDNLDQKYVRMTVGLGVIVYRVYPELVDDKKALQEMETLSYIGTPLKP